MNDGLVSCAKHCIEADSKCVNLKCRLWIEYEKEYNCTLISVHENGRMTLREVGDRLGISFARVKQIESKAIARLKKNPFVASLFF